MMMIQRMEDDEVKLCRRAGLKTNLQWLWSETGQKGLR